MDHKLVVYGSIAAALNDGLLLEGNPRWQTEELAQRKAAELTECEKVEAQAQEREPWWVGDYAQISGMQGYAVGRGLAIPHHEWRANPAGTVHAYAYLTPAVVGERPGQAFGGPSLISVTQQVGEDGVWRGLWRADWNGANMLEDSIHDALTLKSAMERALQQVGIPFSPPSGEARHGPKKRSGGPSSGPQ